MIRDEMELILNGCCQILTLEMRAKGLLGAQQFENRAREILHDQMRGLFPRPAARFTFCYTPENNWRATVDCLWDSDASRSHYIIMGKAGGTPEARWADYAKSVKGVETSIQPQFLIDLSGGVSLFQSLDCSFGTYRLLSPADKLNALQAYGAKTTPNSVSWFSALRDMQDMQDINHRDRVRHIPLQLRFYSDVPRNDRIRLRAEAALVCPRLVMEGRDRRKYDEVALYLLTWHGVLCHQARDLFTAGSAIAPVELHGKNGALLTSAAGDRSVHLASALKHLEGTMRKAALEMDRQIFIDFWGEDVAPADRIANWLQRADTYATSWKPSDFLFLEETDEAPDPSCEACPE